MSKKTNAMRLLDSNKIRYKVLQYQVDEENLDALHVAKASGLPCDQVFKTLVLKGDKTGILIACIPGNGEVDLKLLAKESKNKSVNMVSLKEVLPLTGYIRGGVSPLAMKKLYPLYIDEKAKLWEEISVSAGLRGYQIVLSPLDLFNVAQPACFVKIS